MAFLLDLPEHILREILLRTGAAADDLARACATCTTFRRVIAEDDSFLPDFRAFHAPPVVGFVTGEFEFYPADLDGTSAPHVPRHTSARAARAVARASDFALSFLPRPPFWAWDWKDEYQDPRDCWGYRDSRDGRVLVRPSYYGDLAVCDPLFRRYVLLPPIPDDLAAALVHQQVRLVDLPSILAPTDKEEEVGTGTSFRVVATVQFGNKLVAFVFSSLTGQWRGFELGGWTAMPADVRSRMCSDFDYGPARRRRPFYAHGCFYWPWSSLRNAVPDELVVLDLRRREISIIQLPRGTCKRFGFAIAEKGEGALAIFTRPNNTTDIYYTIRQIGGQGANAWHHNLEFDKIIPFRLHFCFIAGATDGYLLIQGCPRRLGSRRPNCAVHHYSLDVRTMKLQWMYRTTLQETEAPSYGLPFTSFPPSLETPRI